MKQGDTVIVTSSCRTKGRKGVITQIFPNLYHNGHSYVSVNIPSIGVNRVYNLLSIKLVEKGDVEMNNKFTDCVCYVGVKFLQGSNVHNEYAFACYEQEIEKGQIVACDTAKGISLAQVVAVYSKEDYNASAVTKEIINIVQCEQFLQRKSVRAKKNELKEKMDKRVKELQNIAIYETLAKEDEELATLLNEFKSI